MSRIAFRLTDTTGQVTDALETMIEGVEDLSPFFSGLRRPWYDSRREMYDTRGESTETPWPSYSDTPEGRRYVFAKASILGMPRGSRVGDDDILKWGGPKRLHAATVGESSEAQYESGPTFARITIDVPYASHHDEGTGTAPEWAWPAATGAYTTPRRRLVSPAGTFVGGFARQLGEYLGRPEVGGRFGLKAAEARGEIARAFRAAAARAV